MQQLLDISCEKLKFPDYNHDFQCLQGLNFREPGVCYLTTVDTGHKYVILKDSLWLCCCHLGMRA